MINLHSCITVYKKKNGGALEEAGEELMVKRQLWKSFNGSADWQCSRQKFQRICRFSLLTNSGSHPQRVSWADCAGLLPFLLPRRFLWTQLPPHRWDSFLILILYIQDLRNIPGNVRNSYFHYLGMTEADISDFIQVSISRWWNWQNNHLIFFKTMLIL